MSLFGAEHLPLQLTGGDGWRGISLVCPCFTVKFLLLQFLGNRVSVTSRGTPPCQPSPGAVHGSGRAAGTLKISSERLKKNPIGWSLLGTFPIIPFCPRARLGCDGAVGRAGGRWCFCLAAGRAGCVRDAGETLPSAAHAGVCSPAAGTPRARAPSAGTPLFPDGCECARHGRILIAFKPRCQLLCCWNVFTALKQSQALNRVLFSILHTASLGLLLWGLVWQFLS